MPDAGRSAAAAGVAGPTAAAVAGPTAAEVPFFRPSIGEEEIAEVVDCLRGGWLTTGPRAARFEAAFSALMGGACAVAVNSATAGLHLALEAAGVGPGDRVAAPTLTFTATAEVARYLGADPVFTDVDPDTLCMTPETLERAAPGAVAAVAPVHFGGRPCDMEGIAAAAARRGAAVIDDAAHALPARRGGALIGAGGARATVFSFYANKTMTTGEGGMIVTRDRDLAARCRVMRLHGIDRDVFARFGGAGGSWRYDVVAPGFKYNLTDVAAAIGLRQLPKIEALRAARERRARLYHEALADLPLILPAPAGPGDTHAWHLFPVRLGADAPVDRDAFVAALQARGVSVSVHYTPLHRMTYWRERYGLRPEDFPNAERAFRALVSLPLFAAMTDGEQARVIDAVREIVA